jgi:hypothetical protein
MKSVVASVACLKQEKRDVAHLRVVHAITPKAVIIEI